MMSRSCHGWKQWAARAVAGLGLSVALASPAWSDAPAPAAPMPAAPMPAAPMPAAPHAGAQGSIRSAADSKQGGRAGGSIGKASGATATTTITVICFHSSIQCFSARKTRQPDGAPARAAALDLRAPDIARIFPQAELEQTLRDPDEIHEVQQTVQVHGQRELAPVSVGLLAIPWAVMHPTQAWRIFTPLPEAK
jgi:hypothetical protein